MSVGPLTILGALFRGTSLGVVKNDPLLQVLSDHKSNAQTAYASYQEIMSKYGNESTTQDFVVLRNLLTYMENEISRAQVLVKQYIAMGRTPKGSQKMLAAFRAADRAGRRSAASHV